MAFARQSGPQSGDLTTLAVRNWQVSKASSNDDGGVQSLKTFLSKKAQRPVIRASVQGDAFMITVKSSDVPRFTHLNEWTWAGTVLSVEQAESQTLQSQPQSIPFSRQNQTPFDQTQSGPRHQNNSQRFDTPNGSNQRNNNRFGQQGPRNQSRNDGDNVVMGSAPAAANQSNNVEAVMASVVRKRYIAAEKYLTLEALALDPDFVATGLSSSTASKVFAALFVTCEKDVFETPTKRREMVESLSLSNNSLTTVKDVIAAPSTFPNIKNLDLSRNQIADTGEMRFWRNRFRNLEHLILTGNPVDSKPETRETMKRWYPNLKLYNNIPIDSSPSVSQQQTLQPPTPPQSTSPVQTLPTEPHPEFPAGSTFGVPTPDKPQDQLIKEQMGLKFSYETRLKMVWVEQCLTANNFNYDAAVADLQKAMSEGAVPSDAFISA